jgi:hypothetical protein
MRRASVGLSAAILAGCAHDAGSLAPRVEDDLGAWLPHISEASCQACVLANCRDLGQACLEDPECKLNVASCVPPNPSCHQSSIPARNFNVCVASMCADACELSRFSLSCVGDYSWTIPLNGEVAFDLQLIPFGRRVFDGQAEVTVCSGVTPACDADQVVRADTNGPIAVSYAWSTTAARVYFHVTAPGIVPLYFYEDARLTPDYLVNIPIVMDTDYALMLFSLGAQHDVDHGSLSVATFDCVGTRLPGVELRVRSASAGELDPAVIAWTFDDVATPRVLDGAPSTRAQAQAGYVNLPPGVYDIDGYIGERRVASVPSVVVQGGALTHVNMFPLAAREAE